jgi:hypothetical protein
MRSNTFSDDNKMSLKGAKNLDKSDKNDKNDREGMEQTRIPDAPVEGAGEQVIETYPGTPPETETGLNSHLPK